MTAILGDFDKSVPSVGWAAVVTGAYGERYVIRDDFPIPNLAKDEILIRLEHSGVCHGDCYSRDGGFPAPDIPKRPLVGGHEGIGRVVKIGELVEKHPSNNWDVKIGDLVGAGWMNKACGRCDMCKMNRDNFCNNSIVNGLSTNGTFQRKKPCKKAVLCLKILMENLEYLNMPISQVIRIPDEVPSHLACPILCAGVTVYNAIRSADPKPGQWLTIVGGAGGLGHLAIQYGKAMGLKVVAIDGGPAADGSMSSKESLCMNLGADVFLDFTKEKDLVASVNKITDGGTHITLMLVANQISFK